MIKTILYFCCDGFMKCPMCGLDGGTKKLKEWYFGGYIVERYVCGKCEGIFNSYSSHGEVKFTIPKASI